jgi:hypothetical protein
LCGYAHGLIALVWWGVSLVTEICTEILSTIITHTQKSQ